MAENCENFKRPRQLGLSIHTSDVSLYDGSNLNCVDLPDGADLNDVIEAFGEKFCALISLINTIPPAPAAEIPNDPWVTILDNGAGITTPTGTAAHTVYNDLSINVAYKILSSDTAVIKVRAELDVTISSTEGNDDVDHLIDFSFILDNIQIGGSNWFPLEEKMFQGVFPDYLGTNIGVPVVISHSGGDPLVNSAYHSSGRAGCSNSLVFCQEVSPKVAAGDYLFNVEFEMTVQLSDPL